MKDKGFPLHQWVILPTCGVERKETQAGAAALLGAVRAANIGAALASQGAGFPNIVKFTTYLVDPQDIGRFTNTARASIRACFLAAALSRQR